MELLRPLSWKLHVLIWSDKIRTMHKFESIGFRCSWADRKRLGIRQGNEPATLSYPPYCHLILMKSVWFPYTYLSHAQRLSKNSRPSPRLANQKTDALDVYSRQRKRNNLLFFFITEHVSTEAFEWRNLFSNSLKMLNAAVRTQLNSVAPRCRQNIFRTK